MSEINFISAKYLIISAPTMSRGSFEPLHRAFLILLVLVYFSQGAEKTHKEIFYAATAQWSLIEDTFFFKSKKRISDFQASQSESKSRALLPLCTDVRQSYSEKSITEDKAISTSAFILTLPGLIGKALTLVLFNILTPDGENVMHVCGLS